MNELVHLPWPPRELSPNVRSHWAKLAKAKKAYRTTCRWMAVEQAAVHKLQTTDGARGRLRLHLLFVPPTRARRDVDNLVAAMKAGLDGLADALGMDDSLWALSQEIAPYTAHGGRVVVSATWETK